MSLNAAAAHRAPTTTRAAGAVVATRARRLRQRRPMQDPVEHDPHLQHELRREPDGAARLERDGELLQGRDDDRERIETLAGELIWLAVRDGDAALLPPGHRRPE